MRLEFGKHKGQDISEVPTQYLEWLLRADVNSLGPGGKLHVESELFRRRQKQRAEQDRWRARYESFRGESWGEEPRRSQSLGGVQVVIPAQRLALVVELIEAGFRALSMKLHPDKGGTTEQMQELNELRTQLRNQLKEA